MTSSFIWCELLTSDPDAAAAFYGAVLGWKVNDSGQPGMDYRIITMRDDAVGGMMSDARAPRPYWLYYINVDDIDAAHRRVTANGGAALMDPHQVPTGAWIINARDPQGALFALVGPRH
jgi:predicted enzyme related to lactoylglutathione lyase